MTAPAVLPRWWFAALAAGVVAFTLYGSYVPFHWRARDWDEAVRSYRWAVTERRLPESRADWVANVALGVPLGFTLLGWLRVDRRGTAGAVVLTAVLAPACTLFAAAVEFGQLFCEDRTCAGSDIWAQGLGSLIGMLAWAARGQWATDKLRAALDVEAVRSSTAPLLAGYVALVLLVQLLPFDLTASPKELYRRLRDHATLVPFGELLGRTTSRSSLDEYKKVADWLELFALFVPAGLLAAGLPGRFGSVNGLPRVLGLGVLLAGATECLQLLVVSRHPSATDVLVGGFGFTLGWVAARVLAERGVKKYRVEVAVVLAQVWVALLLFVHWQPFDFAPGLFAARAGSVEWLPFVSQASKNYLWALNELLSKFVVYVPLGAVVVWASRRHHQRRRAVVAAGVCGLVAIAVELGQAVLPFRYASPTDVPFGVVGGYLGGEVTRRVMGVAQRVRLHPTAGEPVVVTPPPPHAGVPLPRPGEPWWASAERAYPGVPFPTDQKSRDN